MKLSKKALQEFKEIYKAEFGIELSDSETKRKAINLLTVIKIIYKPLDKTKLNYGK